MYPSVHLLCIFFYKYSFLSWYSLLLFNSHILLFSPPPSPSPSLSSSTIIDAFIYHCHLHHHSHPSSPLLAMPATPTTIFYFFLVVREEKGSVVGEVKYHISLSPHTMRKIKKKKMKMMMVKYDER